MGWTYQTAFHYLGNGKIDRKAECESLLDTEYVNARYEVIKLCMVGSVCYVAVKSKIGAEVFCEVIETETDGDQFGYKMSSEDVGPTECKCPKCILALLTPTDSEWANEWREKCRQYHAKEDAFKKIPLGSKVVAKLSGKEVVLVKHEAAYQFKTWFWAIDGAPTPQYVQKKYVTAYNTRPYVEQHTGKEEKYNQLSLF